MARNQQNDFRNTSIEKVLADAGNNKSVDYVLELCEV